MSEWELEAPALPPPRRQAGAWELEGFFLDMGTSIFCILEVEDQGFCE